ncbi:hypothetical protein WJX77_007272 [Trebouxia sp. C0004]
MQAASKGGMHPRSNGCTSAAQVWVFSLSQATAHQSKLPGSHQGIQVDGKAALSQSVYERHNDVLLSPVALMTCACALSSFYCCQNSALPSITFVAKFCVHSLLGLLLLQQGAGLLHNTLLQKLQELASKRL